MTDGLERAPVYPDEPAEQKDSALSKQPKIAEGAAVWHENQVLVIER